MVIKQLILLPFELTSSRKLLSMLPVLSLFRYSICLLLTISHLSCFCFGSPHQSLNFIHKFFPEDCLVNYHISLKDQLSSSLNFNTQFPKLITTRSRKWFFHNPLVDVPYKLLFVSPKRSSCRISFQLLSLHESPRPMSPAHFFNKELIEDGFQIHISPQITFVRASYNSVEFDIGLLAELPLLQTYTQYVFIVEDDGSQNGIKLVFSNYLNNFALVSVPLDQPIYHYFFKDKSNQQTNGALVYTHEFSEVFRSHGLIKAECNRFGLYFSGTEDFCVIKTLQAELNLTLIFDVQQHDKIVSVLLLAEKPLRFLEGRFASRFPVQTRLEQILTSGTNLPFGFVTVIPKSRSLFSNPLRVFDHLTLTFVGCGWLFVSLAFMFLNRPPQKNGRNLKLYHLGTLKSIGLATLGPLIDQSPSAYIYFFNWNAQRRLSLMRFIHIVWIISCIVISGGYKGSFYAFLTKNPTPKAPRNFNQLLKSNLTLVTLDTNTSVHSSPVSLFFDVVQDFMSKTSTRTDMYANRSSKSIKRMKKLHDRYFNIFMRATHLRHISPGDIAVAYAQHVPLSSQVFFQPSLNPSLIGLSNETFTFPQKFTALSSSAGVSYFSRLIRMATGGDVWLVKSREWDYYIGTYDELLTMRNLLKPLMTNVYLSLKESGIYNLWKHYASRYLVKLDALMIKCLGSEDLARITDEKRLECLEEVKATWNSQSYRNEFFRRKPTGGMSILVALNLIIQLVIGLAIACGIFCLEFLFRNSDVSEFGSKVLPMNSGHNVQY